jgi:predicted PurR-regulated permease PerM
LPSNPAQPDIDYSAYLTVLCAAAAGALGLAVLRLIFSARPDSWLGRIQWRKAIPLWLSVAAGLYFLWCVRSILTPFFISFFLASLLDPVVTRLQKRTHSRGRVVASMFLLFFLLIVLIAVVIFPSAIEQMKDFASRAPEYGRNLMQKTDELYQQYKKPLASVGLRKPPSQFLSDRTGPIGTATQKILDTVRDTILGFVGQVLWLIIIPLSLYYFLLDYQRIRAKLISFVPASLHDEVDRITTEVVEIFSAYIRGLAIVCTLYGIGAFFLFYLLGLNYALFLGITAGAFYAVPIVGAFVAAVSAAVVALTMGKSIAFAALVVVLLTAMQFTFDYVITPRIVGRSVGLHPLINIFALMCGATLFGIWGTLLAVPVAASVQMILVYFFPRLAEKPKLPVEEPPPPARGEPPPSEVEEAVTEPEPAVTS